MENENLYKEERFDSFLNKIIILSSKQYYRNEITKDLTELKIMDDEKYARYLDEYLQSKSDAYNLESIDDFINLCENSMLACGLQSLSDIEMTVIFLLYAKKLKSSEASKILEIYSDSVTRIKKRAIKKLKNYMKGNKNYE